MNTLMILCYWSDYQELRIKIRKKMLVIVKFAKDVKF